MSIPEVFSAARIAELLAEPPKPALVPTDEQRRVIEYPVAGVHERASHGDSVLVIAGAGSGKTETMANRVVWLVANGLIGPEQLLGLTFTRKAAGELRDRVALRLERFSTCLQDAAERGQLTEAESERARALADELADGLNLPDISTYNSFAAAVLQEFGAPAGIAPGAVIIDAAAAWSIARELILASRDPDLGRTELSLTSLIEHVIAIDHAVADNLTSFDRVEHEVTDFAKTINLPYNEKDLVGGPEGKNIPDVRDAVENLRETPLVTRLAREFALEKQRRGLIEFSDQLALATRAIERSPDSIRILRDRHRIVLLDEVQDTSVGQTRLLSMIFAGAPVMAVGDPHQSIYGWRGASAAGLASFHSDFRGRGAGAGLGGTTLTLSTSWRNPVTVLDAANAISAPLAAESAIDVPRLQPRPGAASGVVECVFPETLREEREAVAQWVAAARESHVADHGESPTAAVIFRKRRHMAAFSLALTEASVPNRIVGMGGLLSTPEVTDLVSALRCVWYADAGGDLIRLLAGPRFRVGVADIKGLRSVARWFAERDIAQQRLSESDRLPDTVLPDPDRAFTLIDALDQICAIRDNQHRALAEISDEGIARLRDAGQMLASLRQYVGGDTGELIGATIRALRLDIELEANEARTHDGGAAALANLDAFTELALGYLAIDRRGTLPALLEWVERATADDEAAEHVPAPAPGTVQLITAHGAKGLEWDIVAVPRLVAEEFPSTPRKGVGWLRKGQLPDVLRGDAAARPRLDWRIATDQKELGARIKEYKAELKGRFGDEERRLAYVAVTRSASRLLVSGSFWGGQKKPRPPSPYLLELQEGGIIHGLPEASQHETDPSESDEATLVWPLDPLGLRSCPVTRAAAAVEARLADGASPAPDSIDPTVRLLLAEQRARDDVSAPNELPGRVTASTFHEFVEDPARAERRRQRPVPQRPYRRTQLGNRFHEWVERRSTTAHGTALPLFGFDADEWDPGLAEFEQETELQPLIDRFNRSRWADRQPIAVEQEVTLPFAGRTLVCKLDAVYRDGDRFEIVDWKAGRPPQNDKERELRFFQIDLYRHAYAQWEGVDPAQIDVSLFYVTHDVELQNPAPRSFAELEGVWQSAAGALGGGAGDRALSDSK